MIPDEIIILAGGKGTRLAASEAGVPKCISMIGNTSFLHYVLHYYRQQGLRRFIFSLGFFADPIREYINLHFPDMDRAFVVEKEPLGTGGAVKAALDEVRGNTVCIVNADTYFRVDLSAVAAFHHMSGAMCTLALKAMEDTCRYGKVKMDNTYRITSFEEKGVSGPGLINGGVYILNKAKFPGNDLGEKFSFEKDYLQRFLDSNKIYGVKQEGYFIDIGIPQDLEKAKQELPAYAE